MKVAKYLLVFVLAGFVVGLLNGLLSMSALPFCGEDCANRKIGRFLVLLGVHFFGFLLLGLMSLKKDCVLVRVLSLSTVSFALTIIYFLWEFKN